MRYVKARLRQQRHELAYRVYVTDCLRILTENTARFSGGRYITQDFAASLHHKPADNRTGEEIAADVIRQAGLVVKE